MKSAKHSCKRVMTSLFVIPRQFGLFAEFLDGFFAGSSGSSTSDHCGRITAQRDLFSRSTAILGNGIIPDDWELALE
jgi:hypothetical protein